MPLSFVHFFSAGHCFSSKHNSWKSQTNYSAYLHTEALTLVPQNVTLILSKRNSSRVISWSPLLEGPELYCRLEPWPPGNKSPLAQPQILFTANHNDIVWILLGALQRLPEWKKSGMAWVTNAFKVKRGAAWALISCSHLWKKHNSMIIE